MSKACRADPVKAAAGNALVETLIALPLVLWLGMAALQWALIMNARTAIAYGLNEAGRAGSVAHADQSAIDLGLARGLAPFLFGAADPGSQQANVGRAQAHLTAGKSAGWVTLRQISPTDASFSDWAEAALGPDGEPDAAQLEIPNDNLRYRMRADRPKGGVDGYRGEEPIGAASGQTLLDANLLKLELVYGVPMTVPFIGRLTAWVLAQVDGCDAPAAKQVGLIDLGTPAVAARPWACAFYQALDDNGRLLPRLPVRVFATVRMQSPARYANGASHRDAAFAGESLGVGDLNPVAGMLGDGHTSANPVPAGGPAIDSGASGGPGFLNLGGQRSQLSLGACDSG